MILGLPVVDGHEVTKKFLEHLIPSVADPDNFQLIIIDNASIDPYRFQKLPPAPFPIKIVRNLRNKGYYYPLKQIYKNYRSDNLMGLIHNDVLIYEKGWDLRLRQAFADDPKLGLVGFAGSNEIDAGGGRGGGTMLRFRGTVGEGQSAGKFIDDLRPSVVFDSLFMMFRTEIVPDLLIDEDITLAHFYDRIWSCRVMERGWRSATLGIEIDHMGGMTIMANTRYRDDCIRWLKDRDILYVDPETEMYLEGQRRFLSEYRDQKKMVPCIIEEGKGYEITFTAQIS